jgi:nucleoside phosphorylase
MQHGRYGKTTVGILTVIREEFEAVKLALAADTRYPRSRYVHPADGCQRFVLGMMADRGNVAAGEATRDLFEYWRPDIVMLVGIAGALSSGDAGLGDVVIPDYVHYGDFRKITEAGDALRFAAYDQPTVSLRTDTVEGLIYQAGWTETIAEPRPPRKEAGPSGATGNAPKVEVGGLVAGEKILGDPDHPEQERVFVSFDNAIAVDMESFGVARAVHHQRVAADYNPRLTIVRGVSDIVERRVGKPAEFLRAMTPVLVNSEQRSTWKRYAAASAAAFAAAVVDELTS